MSENENKFFVDTEKLPGFAGNTARMSVPDGHIGSARAARAIASDLREIGHAYSLAAKSSASGTVTGACEWLLDNWYIAQREGRRAIEAFSRSGRLRSSEGAPILVTLCTALVRSGDCVISEERCRIFLEGFQQKTILSRKELLLFTDGLRAALIAVLASHCRGLFGKEPPKGTTSAFSAIFSSLRMLGNIDLSEMLEDVDRTEQILRKDPAGVYPLMDERTRDSYRLRISKLARRHGLPEERVASRALHLAVSAEIGKQHIGRYIFTEPMGREKAKRNGGVYISINVLVPLFIALLLGFLTESPLCALLSLLPVSELVKNILDYVVLRTVPPARVPRLECRGGVPESGRTICVISSIITGSKTGPALATKLEEYRLSNRDAGRQLLFGVLADLPDTKEETIKDSGEWLDAAQAAFEGLNVKYGGGFFLLFRDREFSEAEQRWMGRDRKRGAIAELAKLISGRDSSLRCLAGDKLSLRGTRFIITLDADTRLCPGSARELIGAMLHPLNRPVFDEKAGTVISGHGVISPRIAVDVAAAGKSDFSRIFAGQGGTDPYCSSCGEVYMDLFDRGGFSGKGIIDARALLKCTDKNIPEGKVLSHDAIEGALLRGAYMGDTELSDGFPSGTIPYFRRLHRWVRGDWQNAPWLFRRGRGRVLSSVDRWKLFDCLRRSLLPPAVFSAILVSFFFPNIGTVCAAVAGLLCLVSPLLVTVAESAFRPEDQRGARYHSSILYGVPGALANAAMRLVLLPFEAWVCLSAVFMALWRMIISHRNLLAWQTAAQSECKKYGPAQCFTEMWIAVPVGILSAFFSPSVLGKAAGIIWLISPLCAYLLGLPHFRVSVPDEGERKTLTEYGREIWRYFEAFTGKADNWLPPDNWQEQPMTGPAHRTSPTNIGLFLVSAVNALDLGLASKEAVLPMVERTLSTVERLQKWRGHPYNWYDTMTLEPLHPAYVSTVDSGNFAVCLIVTAGGLSEYGRDDLALRCRRLFNAMDFTALYDPKRRLFRIGFDIPQDRMTDGWYDLMASEARLTGFVAIAKGDVERRHWRQLSRAQLRCDMYRGMASWTGTMFEYFMPELFLPLKRDTLLYESAEFCMYIQKRRARGTAPVWGQSESAFFAMDPSLCYRYKAHGCAAMALKRGMDREYVVSPYSSFLALVVEPKSAVANLRKLEELGMRGRFGFWEAIDFTPSRRRASGGEVVRCVMAHHLGMSMAALANRLLDNINVRRFMADPAMRSHTSLLEEKVPIGGPVLHRREYDVPERPTRSDPGAWTIAGDGVDLSSPECCILSNSAYSLLFSESGLSRAQAGELDIYRGADASPFSPSLSLSIRSDGATDGLLPCTDARRRFEFSWEFTCSYAAVAAADGNIEAVSRVIIPTVHAGEIRDLSLRSESGGKYDILLTFEPVLARYSDYVNHPAFWRLGMSSELRDGALLIRRAGRNGANDVYLALACSRHMSVSTDRRAHISRPAPPVPESGFMAEPFVCASVPVSVKSGERADIRFALCLGNDAESALAGARDMLQKETEASPMPATCGAFLGLGASDIGKAMSMLKYLVFPMERRPFAAPVPREELYKLGISGDFPLICAKLASADKLPAAGELLRRFCLLRGCGMKADLVFLPDEGGDYRMPLRSALYEGLREIGHESLLGAKGGVHVASTGGDAVIGAAALVRDLALPDSDDEHRRDPATAAVKPVSPPFRESSGKYLEHRWLEDGSFQFYVNQTLPPRAWSNILSWGSFGCIASDFGPSCMWFGNSRENRISHWEGDPLAVRGPEALELTAPDGGKYSIFAAPDGLPCRVTYGFGFASWEKSIGSGAVRTTAFISPDGDFRLLLIEPSGLPDARLSWRLSLQLGPAIEDAQQVETDYVNLTLKARNPRFPEPDARFLASFSSEPQGFTCSLPAAVRGEYGGERGAGLDPCFAAAWKLEGPLVLACGCGSLEKLRALCSEAEAGKALKATVSAWHALLSRFEVKTPDEALNRALNGWLPYQTIACRLFGRCSMYQSGGAFGFRDQLQDTVNLLMIEPELAKRQILLCASRQFLEGDVQHWWHPEGGKGVRTRCSDDLLWLIWAVCEYVEKTGDESILGKKAPYLESQPLRRNERERYETPHVSQTVGTVLEHCRRALDLMIARGTGEHGLLFIGTGDWNDGFSEVGAEGRGESVWLSWFFSGVANRFAGLTGDAKYAEAAEAVGRAADAAWDGAWYLRGYFDSGEPLGGSASEACRIDLVAQTFSVFSPDSSAEKRRQALDSVLLKLFDRPARVVKLFDPPFVGGGGPKPGYISGYGPGFRENGGQYTHGAAWLISALLQEGRVEEGFEVLKAVLPANHASVKYGAEPFVVAADVSSAPGFEGQAGWSWYTGSAGWLFSIALEELLGIRLAGGEIEVRPRLPKDWDGYSAVIRRPGEAEKRIEVSRDGVFINGRAQEKKSSANSQKSKNMV